MAAIAAACCLCLPLSIHAYIDPGTGSYVVQIVIAAFVAVAFAAKVYWQKVRKFICGLFSKKTDGPG